MKLTMTRVLTPLAALAITLGVQGVTVTTGFETSEGFTAGQGVTPTQANGFDFVAGPDSAADASVVTAYADASEKPTARPDKFASDGDNYLKLSTEDGTLFRNVKADGTPQAVGAGFYLDTVVQFTVTDVGDRPVPSTTLGQEDKFIIWLEQDGDNKYLCTYGGEYGESEDGSAIERVANKVYRLNASGIEPGSWHRLTVKAVADMGVKINSGSTYVCSSIPAFQVYIDGTLAKSSSEIMFDNDTLTSEFDATSIALINSKEFIPSMQNTDINLTKVGFSGEGKIDDIVLTSDIPNCVPHDAVTISWDTTVLTSLTVDVNGTPTDTLTGGNATLNIPAGAVLTFNKSNMTFADGKPNKHGFGTWTTSGDGVDMAIADVDDDRTVTVTTGGTLGLVFSDIAPTFNFTLDFSGLTDALVETSGCEIDSISYTLNGGSSVDVSDSMFDGSQAITGVKGGDVIAVTVTFISGTKYRIGTCTASTGVTVSGTTFTVGANVEDAVTGNLVAELIPAEPNVLIWDGHEYTLSGAIAALASGDIQTTAEKPLALTTALTLTDSANIPAAGTVYFDLAGYTLTGPANGAAFTVAGALTILDSSNPSTGKVLAGASGSVASITGVGVLTITGGAYSDAVSGATFPTGYGLIEDQEVHLFKYGAKTYTITYDGNGVVGGGPGDTTFTVLAASTIRANTFTAPANKEFSKWNTASDGSGTDYAAGAATPTVTSGLSTSITLYAIWVDASSGTELAPGEQDDTGYSDKASADAAASGITITPAPAVASALTADGALAAYTAKFEVKAVEKDGKWYNEVALTAQAAADLQTQANADAVTAAADVAGAADDDVVVTITTTPGFYYSVKFGTSLSNMTEGDRTLATGTSMDITLPQGADAGFYSILVNIGPKVAE